MSHFEADNKDNHFRKAYAEVVTEAMSILGEGTQIVTNYLEEKYSITLANTCDNPSALSAALHAVLGGSMRIIQRRILRLLYERIDIRFPSSMTVNFEERIAQVRKEYENRGSGSPLPTVSQD